MNPCIKVSNLSTLETKLLRLSAIPINDYFTYFTTEKVCRLCVPSRYVGQWIGDCRVVMLETKRLESVMY